MPNLRCCSFCFCTHLELPWNKFSHPVGEIMGIIERSCGKEEAWKLHGDEPRNPDDSQYRDPRHLTLSRPVPVSPSFLSFPR